MILISAAMSYGSDQAPHQISIYSCLLNAHFYFLNINRQALCLKCDRIINRYQKMLSICRLVGYWICKFNLLLVKRIVEC